MTHAYFVFPASSPADSNGSMTTTFQKRQKEHKRQEKQKAKAEVRRNKAIARRTQEHYGRAAADSNTHAATVTDHNGHDIENPT
jgi:sRNA-binding protein